MKEIYLSDYPHLLLEYDREKNTQDPLKLKHKSAEKVYWKCSSGHSWQAIVYNRTRGQGCSYCSKNHNLFITHPVLQKEWNFKRNIISPYQVSYGSNKKVWWICKNGHEWRAIIYNRSKGHGCPYCANQKKYMGPEEEEEENISGTYIVNRSIVNTHPHLMDEWDTVKNLGLDPNRITYGSAQKVWWRCEKGHQWQASVSNRTHGKGCPYCCNRYISIENSFVVKHPHLLDEWDFDKNKGINPFEISCGSNRKIWWNCIKGHEWQAPINSRVRGHGCKFCAYESRRGVKIAANEQSIAVNYPELMNEWHPSNNTGLDPHTISCGSKQKVWWKCTIGHEWQAEIRSRVRGNGCPYCANRIICKSNSILTTHPEIMNEWNWEKNTGIDAGTLSYGTQKRVWWKCEKGHEWQACVCSRALGQGCPFCSNKKVTIENSIVRTHPEFLEEWNVEKNNEIKPENITFGSRKKVWWKCKKGHEWQASLSGRSRGEGCPFCSTSRQTSFPEQAIYYYINRIFPALNRAKIYGCEIDIFIASLSIGIEYDGLYFHKGDTLHREQKKDKYLKEKNIQIIRIKEDNHDKLDYERCRIFCRPTKNYLYLNNTIKHLIKLIEVLIGEKIEYELDIDINNDKKKIWMLYK